MGNANKPDNDNTAYVVVFGGTEAKENEFPHMVALGKYNSKTFTLTCGATLISDIWVLSAAHCTHGLKYTSIIFYFLYVAQLR
jgi:secreted trypsin-like serine protease